MKKMKRFCILFLVFLVGIVATGQSVSANNTGNEDNKKISKEVFEKADIHPDKYIPLIIAVSNIDKAELDIFKKEYVELNYKNDKTNDKEFAKKFKEDKIKFISEKQKKINKDFLKNLDVKYKIIYESEYMPIIYIEVLGEDIPKLENVNDLVFAELLNEEVEMVLIEGEGTSNPTFDYNDTIGVYDIHDDYGVTGSGIKIGIWELGIPELDNEEYEDRIYAYTLGGDENYHTTNVAILSAGRYGVAPGASIIALETGWDGYSDDGLYFSDLDKFVYHGADVINASFGINMCSDNLYDIYGIYTDYYISTFDIPIVAASGNNNCGGNSIDSYPQMAYNTITVGATSTDGTVYSSYNSYNEEFYYGKPNIIAPGGHSTSSGCGLFGWFACHYDMDIPGGTDGQGTSYAAPLVTGIIALMYEEKPLLKNDVSSVIALVNASGDKDAISTCLTDINQYDGMSNKCGAGLIDAVKIFDMLDHSSYYNYSFLNEPTGSTESIEVYLYQGEEFVLSSFYLWSEDAQFLDGCYIQPWIKVQVTAPNGTLMITNYEYLHHSLIYSFDVTATGKYEIEITFYVDGGYPGEERGAIAWYPARARYIEIPPSGCS